jgi:hypothetical protein
METEEPTNLFPWLHPATEDIHIVTENFIVFPVDTGHLSENMETYKRSDNDNNNLEKSVGTIQMYFIHFERLPSVVNF